MATVPSGKMSGKAGKKKGGQKESGIAGKNGTTVPKSGTTEKRRDSNREKK